MNIFFLITTEIDFDSARFLSVIVTMMGQILPITTMNLINMLLRMAVFLDTNTMKCGQEFLSELHKAVKNSKNCYRNEFKKDQRELSRLSFNR